MKIILLEIIALICISAGIYFDQILVVFGSTFIFFAWTCIYAYKEESQAQTYNQLCIQLFLLLVYFGLLIYLIMGLFKDALLTLKELLGLQPDFLSYLIAITLFVISYYASGLLSNKLINFIKQNK